MQKNQNVELSKCRNAKMPTCQQRQIVEISKCQNVKAKQSKCKIVDARTCQHCKVARFIKVKTWQRQKADKSKCQHPKKSSSQNMTMSKCQNIKTSTCQEVKMSTRQNIKISKCQNARMSQIWFRMKSDFQTHDCSSTSNFIYSDSGNTTTHTNNEFEKRTQLLKQRLATKERQLHQHNSFADCSSYSARPHLDFEPDLPAKKDHIGDRKLDVISGTTFGTALREFESRSPSIICLIFHGVGGEGVNSH